MGDARLSRNKNLVTRAVGIDPEVNAEVHVHDVEVGDIYLLCSDGLNDMVEDEDIGTTLQMLQANPALAAARVRAEQRLGDSGRVLIRASGTEPVLRVMVEARDGALGQHCAQQMATAAATAP